MKIGTIIKSRDTGYQFYITENCGGDVYRIHDMCHEEENFCTLDYMLVYMEIVSEVFVDV